jgi:hypothetical protein
MLHPSTYLLYEEPEQALNPKLYNYLKDFDALKLQFGMIDTDELYNHEIEEIKKEGFYDVLKDDKSLLQEWQRIDWRKEREPLNPYQLTLFDQTISSIGFWEKNGERIPVSDTDAVLLTGMPAYCMLTNAQELAKFKKQNIPLSLDEMLYMGALNFQEKDYDRVKDTWTIEKNGKTLKRSIGGDMHGDLRVWSKDVSQPAILNPLGRPSNFRPVDKKATQRISGYHSTEPALLCIAIRYVQELKGESYVSHMLPQIQAKAKATTYASGAYTVVGGGMSRKHLFISHSQEFPRNANTKYGFSIHLQHQGSYKAHLNDENELLFSIHGQERMKFYPEEAERLVEATLKQIYGGGGRTLPATADEMIEYRLSEEYQQHLKGIF